MDTPVLSEKQQKKALSAKKAPIKGLRNLLAQPYELHWPNLDNDKGTELRLLLELLMPAIKRSPVSIPWAHLNRLKKTERQAARIEARSKLGNPLPDTNILKSIVMGVNEVTRLLENDDASCILLEANVEPVFLIKHIVSMAESKNVPALLVPFLKMTTLKTIGFASAAIALKKLVAESEEHHFHELYKKTVVLANNIPKNNPVELDFKEHSLTLEETTMKAKDNEQTVASKSSFVLSEDVYKYRSSRKERVFVPNLGVENEVDTQKVDDNFIKIDHDLGFLVADSSRRKNEKKSRYVDMRWEAGSNYSKIKSNNSLLAEDASLNINPESPKSSSDQVCPMETECLSKTQSEILDANEKILSESIVPKSNTVIKKRNKQFKYQSLKIKRIQGNPNRIKATKISKTKKR